MKNNNIKIKFNELVIQSRTDNLTKIREFVYSAAKQAGASKEVIEDIILAVDEAITNIIKHAYKLYPEGKIFVKIKYTAKIFTVVITDYGIPLESSKVKKPDIRKYCRQHKIGGLGMYLMKTLMDEVKYTSVPGKYNQVLLTKNLNTSSR